MSSPYGQRIEELLGACRGERAQVGELRAGMREARASVTALWPALKVTVDAQGEVTGIALPTGAYERMAPAELSQLLLTRSQKAWSKAAVDVAEVLSGHIPERIAAGGLLRGEADLGGLLPGAPPMSDEVREYIENGRPGRGASGPRIGLPPMV